MSTAVANRVMRDLTPAEQFKRAVDRAAEIRDAAYARADADFVHRVKNAVETLFPVPRPAANGSQETAAVASEALS